MHCISHHLYPNTELDYEIAGFEPVAYYLRSLPENKLICQIILEMSLVFAQPINMTMKLLVLPLTKHKKPDFLYSFPLLVILFGYFMTGSLAVAFKYYLITYCFYTFLLFKVLFCGHRVQDTWTEGC